MYKSDLDSFINLILSGESANRLIIKSLINLPSTIFSITIKYKDMAFNYIYISMLETDTFAGAEPSRSSM